MAPGVNMTITLADSHLISQMSRQGKIPLFAESETMFFPKVVNAEIEFPRDDKKGPASQLILHQNGRDMTAKRLDDAEAKKVAAAAAAIDKRFKDQTPAPGSEAALRRMIEELRLGKPNYDLLSPGLAAATRQQLPQLQSMIVGMGPLQSVSFKGSGRVAPIFIRSSVIRDPWTTESGLGQTGKPKAQSCSPANSSLVPVWHG
jgi:hypothetical protein